MARKHQSMTQEQLASVAGVGVRFVRELEQGKKSCHLGKTITVLSMIGLSLDIIGIQGDGRGIGAGRGNGDGSGWG
jgi:y4mF family transcriptional regulator